MVTTPTQNHRIITLIVRKMDQTIIPATRLTVIRLTVIRPIATRPITTRQIATRQIATRQIIRQMIRQMIRQHILQKTLKIVTQTQSLLHLTTRIVFQPNGLVYKGIAMAIAVVGRSVPVTANRGHAVNDGVTIKCVHVCVYFLRSSLSFNA
jgi:hypothetical protein